MRGSPAEASPIPLDVALLNPLAVIGGRRVNYLRDWCGGEVPGSVRYPPVDLASAAALLRARGFSATVIDACGLGLSHRALLRRVARLRPATVGIPSAWGSLADDLALARRIKERLPGVRVVLSGPNVTLSPALALRGGAADFVVLGELEPAYLDLLQGRREANLAFLEGGALRVTPRRLWRDLDALPFPARDLLPNARYRNPATRRNPFTMVWSSRGCPYPCAFCQVRITYLDRVRFRSPESVLAELREVRHRFGIPQVVFKDQTLTLRRRRLLRICELLAREGLDLRWRCFATVDTVDRELLAAMRAAGCDQICYGFESGDAGVLARCGKGTTLEQGVEAARLTRAAGIEVAGTFLLGLAGDDLAAMRRTVDFAVALGIDYAQFLVAQAPTRDPHLARAASGRWDARGTLSNPGLSHALLRDELRRAYRRFYLRPAFLAQELAKLRTPRDLWVKVATAGRLFLGGG